MSDPFDEAGAVEAQAAAEKPAKRRPGRPRKVKAAEGEALRRCVAAVRAASDLPCLVDGPAAEAEGTADGVLVDL